MTPGLVTLKVLHRWEKACKEYFRVKGITERKKVESVLSRLQDIHIADWIEANEMSLVGITFVDFMMKLRAETLALGTRVGLLGQ